MGRTHTPKYRIELTFVDFIARKKSVASFAYMVDEHGPATEVGAKKYRDGMNDSLKTHNAHLANGQSPYSNATIVRQSDGEVVAQYVAPAFEIVE